MSDLHLSPYVMLSDGPSCEMTNRWPHDFPVLIDCLLEGVESPDRLSLYAKHGAQIRHFSQVVVIFQIFFRWTQVVRVPQPLL
jgi:hypothetical protein